MRAISLVALLLPGFCLADGDQQFAQIGDLKLESGKVLRDCKVGYRTFGKLSANKDNVILIPTWFLGKSSDWMNSFGPGGLVESSRYYIIVVDALTNGVSTSPSNSSTQKDAAYPQITVRDMVESQHAMLGKIGIPHLRAVMGISMGGMQTFQWMTAYPNYMDKAIPIVGSPQASSYDLMFYSAGERAIRQGIAHPESYTDLLKTYSDFFWLALNTPSYYVRNTKRDGAFASMEGFEKALAAWNPYDMAVGLNALSSNDVYSSFGGDKSRAARAVRAKTLLIVSEQDHCVNPAPALEFAKLSGAKTLILKSDFGHSAPGAEGKVVNPAVKKFLEEK